MSFNKEKCSFIVFVFFSVFSSLASFAGTMGTLDHFPKGHFLAQLGGYSAIQGRNQDIYVRENLVGNYYSVTTHNQGSGVVGLGYLLDGPLVRDRFPLSYGVNAFFLGQTSVSGYIVEEHLFTTLSYHYKIQSIPLYAMAKTVVNSTNDHYKFVFDAGVGPNFMSASRYSEVALTEYTIPDNAFVSRNNIIFSATAGVSLRFNNAEGKLPLECGYRFFYLGKGRFTVENDQALNALKTGTNYANAFICSVII